MKNNLEGTVAGVGDRGKSPVQGPRKLLSPKVKFFFKNQTFNFRQEGSSGNMIFGKPALFWLNFSGPSFQHIFPLSNTVIQKTLLK